MLKRLILVIVVILSETCLWAQTDTIVTEYGYGCETVKQAQSWPLGMQTRLDSMMRDPLLDCTQLGLMVWDLTDNCSLFAYNHRQLLRPASTMKVLTAVTALDVLGGDYEFTTSLYYKGKIQGRTLQGDLYCVGCMDPTFSRNDLKAFA